MSTTNNTHIDNNNILKLDAKVFAPMLDEHLVAHNPPLFIEPPLTCKNFTNKEFTNVFLDHFDNTVLTLTHGFTKGDNSTILNKDQWLRASAQLMAAIQHSLY